SKRLAAGFDKLAGVACFSATLQPQSYFRTMLGITDTSHWYQVPSPYPEENLHVAVAGHVDTSFGARKSSIQPIVRIIEAITAAKPGGYIVFFPSYRYLELVHGAFVKAHPDINVVVQSRYMEDKERQEFLEQFSGGTVCGFAVMSGVFSEGIDLKGRRLIGAIIIGVGLPGLGIDRDLIGDRFNENGFEFAYQYPGLIRVLQTAGRVIRSEQDEGVVCLVDRRYRQVRYRQLLPDHWKVTHTESLDGLKRGLSEFWTGR
ncbi:MAG: ATP-dependent DNA helicase, partial [Pseudomonadales bacterium]|nr:ATP-dependent DNA helicase [Pseudomonadales bacterium]